MPLNERQVAIREGGNFAHMGAFLDRRQVIGLPLVESQKKTPSSANFILLDSGVVSGNLAVGAASVESAGLMAAELAGAVGTGAITSISDSIGNILNIVELFDPTSGDPLLDTNGRKIYALIQSANAVADGTAIGAPASENCQMSFVVFGSDSVLALTVVNQEVQFTVSRLYKERDVPTIYKAGGTPGNVDVIAPIAVEPDVRKFVVTTAFVADEVLTLSDGTGAASGISTDTGDVVLLDASAVLFNANGLSLALLNGVELEKGVEVVWDSTDSLHVNIPMQIGDVLQVKVAA